MKRQLTIILTFLTLASCRHSKTEGELSKLEKLIFASDNLTSDSNIVDTLVKFIQTQNPKFRQRKVISTTKKTSSPSREIEVSYDFDTTKNYKDRVLFSLRVKEYNSERQAAEAFYKKIEFYTCCIPDEDIRKLKNLENLKHVKNSASTTILSGNLMIEFRPANQTFINEEIVEAIDKILQKRNYLKLQIEHGGPAVWTISKKIRQGQTNRNQTK